MKDTNPVTEINEPVRKTVYIDESLFNQAKALEYLAGVDSFSAFVSKALKQYISQLMLGIHAEALTKDIKKAIANALNPINVRLSKSLYRYAVQLDMLSQFVGYQNEFNWREIEAVRKEAQENVAKMRGQIDVGKIIGEMNPENAEDYDEYD